MLTVTFDGDVFKSVATSLRIFLRLTRSGGKATLMLKERRGSFLIAVVVAQMVGDHGPKPCALEALMRKQYLVVARA